MIRIRLTSVLVNDQERAHRFYTEVLGFVTKQDIPMGDARWLTVASPAAPDEVELLLEPIGQEFARSFQESLFAAGIPAAAFAVDDIAAEHERMKALGVRFKTEPTAAGPVTIAVLDDTCGNLIQLFQV